MTHRKPTGRFLIFLRDDFQCAYCGVRALEDQAILHIDHIVPLFAGGQDIASNLITACDACNMSKGSTRLPPDQEARYLAEARRRNRKAQIEDIQHIALVPRRTRLLREEAAEYSVES